MPNSDLINWLLSNRERWHVLGTGMPRYTLTHPPPGTRLAIDVIACWRSVPRLTGGGWAVASQDDDGEAPA